MRLGIDLDGVVADFNAGWISRYNDEFGGAIPFDAVQSWDGIHPLTHFEHAGEFWSWAAGHGGSSIFRHLDPYPGAVETLRALVDAGNDIVILTQKPTWAIADTFAWIGEHRLPTREVHILADKGQVACDVYLDDAPHQLQRLRMVRPEATVCRFVRPWNEPVPGAVDIDSWTAFRDLVEGRLQFESTVGAD
jgi:5'(3')-deoxyribonucleotidase